VVEPWRGDRSSEVRRVGGRGLWGVRRTGATSQSLHRAALRNGRQWLADRKKLGFS
jgi:hypothetical protein